MDTHDVHAPRSTGHAIGSRRIGVRAAGLSGVQRDALVATAMQAITYHRLLSDEMLGLTQSTRP